MKTAKIFLNGRSQAVRLPAEFRFDCDEVLIRRDPVTGEVILSPSPRRWTSSCGCAIACARLRPMSSPTL